MSLKKYNLRISERTFARLEIQSKRFNLSVYKFCSLAVKIGVKNKIVDQLNNPNNRATKKENYQKSIKYKTDFELTSKQARFLITRYLEYYESIPIRIETPITIEEGDMKYWALGFCGTGDLSPMDVFFIVAISADFMPQNLLPISTKELAE